MVSSWLPPAFVHRSFGRRGSLVDGGNVNRHLNASVRRHRDQDHKPTMALCAV